MGYIIIIVHYEIRNKKGVFMNILPEHLERFDTIFHQLLFFNKKNNPAIPNGMSELLRMNPLDSKILNILFEYQEMTLHDLNDNLGLSNSTLTSAIKRLESKGYIERCICKSDMRSYLLKLTSISIELQKVHKAYEKELFNKILSFLDSDKEIESLLLMLEKIILKARKEF